MKITFDVSANQNTDKVAQATTSYRDARTVKETGTGAYALDISGTVMDNRAYKGQGKTAEDVMQEAGQIDVATQKDYLTVMSNTMSGADFAEMLEEGYSPTDMQVDDAVTIMDRIKAALLEGGTQVIGYTDQIDADTLSEITGSEQLARDLLDQFAKKDIPCTEENVRETMNAYGQAVALQEPSEGAVKFMVENGSAPTIENLYRAQHSASGTGERQGRGYYADDVTGYYARKADDLDWEQLAPQMEQVIEDAGLSVNDDTMENAKWLVERGVPLTTDAMRDSWTIRNLSFPVKPEQALSAITSAIADGKSAEQANLVDQTSQLEKASAYVKDFSDLAEKMDPSDVTARRQLEEVRLLMTTEANLQLLESGYSIDTKDLEALVDALKEAEARQNTRLYHEPDAEKAAAKADLYQETRERVTALPQMPVDVIGRFTIQSPDFTLEKVSVEGAALRREYEQAQAKYEPLMTAPRADMGDSIRKAFRNVDDILEDLDFARSEENERAVRILGYNRMAVTPENILNVKEADAELQKVIRRLTPQTTLQLIRDGKNPLEMTIPALREMLESSEYSEQQDAEKYSKFLYKLDRKKEITDDERQAYIGIYRMLRQIEKGEDAAIGAVLQTGAEFSFKNLVSALRSSKKGAMDYKVDDAFGGIDAVAKGPSITDQIAAGFGRFEQALAGEMADAWSNEDAEAGEAYVQEQADACRGLQNTEDALMEMLLDAGEPVTVNNLQAAEQLMNNRGDWYRKLREKDRPSERASVSQTAEKVQEAMTDRESLQEAYGQMQEAYTEILEETKYDTSVTFLDLKAIQSCQKQLALAGSLAGAEEYQIPVDIHGEPTAIHVKILHGTRQEGRMKISLDTPFYGSVAAEFEYKNNSLSGYIASDSQEGAKRLTERKEKLTEQLASGTHIAEEGFSIGDISILHNGKLDLNRFDAEGTRNEEKTSTALLYQIAKAFITVVTEQEDEI